MSLLNDELVRQARQPRSARRRLRRALREQDRVSAMLAELSTIKQILGDASQMVGRGWMQHGWFTYVAPSGKSVAVTAFTPWAARRLTSREVTGGCLVGSIIHAAGGPSRADSQVVRRTLDLTWHALYRSPSEQVRWCPSPLERAGHVVDLICWNDRSGRTADDVVALLDRADELVGVETARTSSRRSSVDRRVAALTSVGM